ncbi:signal transduction histidine kinase [Stackebrandtia endophytica]|uniref:histidine kinase n=1 Tax=Stackebrandtia endophytica TaxID=1496996 RepID=A0A543AWC3_9ACTN|nr:histidine kinase [Stackebrandtia endophytica]TQL76854.1 signal transduction histidine kinase [Stackebrandtia endophytica]
MIRAIDVVIAVGVTGALSLTVGLGQDVAMVGPLGYVLPAVSGLMLVWRRRAPVPVLIATGLCAVAYQGIGVDVPAVAYLFAVYSAVRAGHRVTTIVASVVMLASLPVAALLSGTPDAAGAFARARGALEIAWLVAAGAAGEALRQAERRADEAERTREETARRRADEERLHIARELHDSLTHQISIIKVQAEVAVHVANRRGEPVPESLMAIRVAGREAARELRSTLEVLRDDATSPPRGMDDLPDLVERTSAMGFVTALSIDGDRARLSAMVDRAVYRIVQESLTNIGRHAGAAVASVHVDCGPHTVTVRVDDDGVADVDDPPVPGTGLLGMRERVSALGGRLITEPRSGGGYTVLARLPVGEEP